ncbi:ATP-binding protein [Nocardiopsis metallicus]|uniref:Anti-sigma regulatory factor (Ser/Thr protein kinase) n=1 Tax=Nocardiopsis metallicus TaxID=179819 RepID=A0A840WHG6_9ACTN|nr:ATP-binding protein [Nocardiopsis metallicus]MBB5495494.1 anti-sigma regulatory factor (Ser/Thr protein kinase) [Nocardiopsis metallicus]
MPTFAPELARSEVTVPLASFIKPYCAHYFSGGMEGAYFRKRQHSFPGNASLLPLVRMFLSTCGADQSTDYRHLFTLLGAELANNAVAHSRSSEFGATYTLVVERTSDGMLLTCRDQGSLRPVPHGPLVPHPGGLDLDSEAGRGLAMVDALSTRWGDNGHPEYRSVWFFLAYDLSESRWNSLEKS